MCECEQTVADMVAIRDRWEALADSDRANRYAVAQANGITDDIDHVLSAHRFCVAAASDVGNFTDIERSLIGG